MVILAVVAVVGFIYYRAHRADPSPKVLTAIKEVGGSYRIAEVVDGDDRRSAIVEVNLGRSAAVSGTVALLTGERSIGRLDLSYTRVNDQDMVHLRGMPITWLSLEGCSIGDAAVSDIATLPQLNSLNLARTQVAGGGLALLEQSPHLEVLVLDGTHIGDADLPRVERLAHLQVVTLHESLVTAAGVKRLKANRPGLAVEWRASLPPEPEKQP